MAGRQATDLVYVTIVPAGPADLIAKIKKKEQQKEAKETNL
jgi:hypothetical protein